MAILRLTARWTGFSGAPGYSAFHYQPGLIDGGLFGDIAQEIADRIDTAFQSLTSALPGDVSVQVEPEVEEIDETTGEILGFVAIDPAPPQSGVSSEGYSAASGAVVNWRTDDVRAGRRIRGRTFLVPLDGGSYDSDGTLTSTALGQIRNWAGFISNGPYDADFGVWSRPRDGAGGVFAPVTNFTVPDMAAVLRSRRD